MRTLHGPIWSRYSIARLASPDHISSAHRARQDWARVGMNVFIDQEKEKNEETKTGERKTGKEKKQATEYRVIYVPQLLMVMSL